MHMKAGGESTAATTAAEWRIGWLLVVTALIAYGSAAVYSYALGLFIAPLQAEYGWSRGSITGGMMISATLTSIGAPFIGRLIDIHGSRRIGLPGMAVYCFAVAMLGSTSASIWNWWALWVLFACGSVLVKPTVWIAAVSRAFTSSRGLAIAVTMTGGGIFAAITPTVVTLLIDELGWRLAFVALGAGLAAINLPLLFLFFGKRRAAQATTAAPAAELTGFAIRPSMLSRRYLQLAAVAFLVTTAMIGIQVHLVPILTSMGLERMEAAGAAGMMGVGSVIGRLITGLLLDRFNGPLVGIFAFSLGIAASLLLLFAPGGNMVFLGAAAAFIFGSALGAEMDIIAYLTGRYFGMRNYGTLFGSLIALVALAAGTGPTLAGVMFDRTGDYSTYLVVAMGLFAFGMIGVGTLGRYPDSFDEQAQG